MKRRDFLKWTTAATASLATGRLALGDDAPAASTGARARRPNVLVILTDDQGWGDLSAHGNANLQTPRIDSLARDGAQLEHFYVCPVCSPTRAEFLTGRYHLRGGVHGVSVGQERLNLDERTIAQLFRDNGYATGCFGKWHNGSQGPYHPNARGFEEFYGFTSGHWGHYFDSPMEHNGRQVRGKGFIIDDLTDRAMEFMAQRSQADKPFFCYLAYNTPHSPFQVPDRFWEKFKDHPVPMRGGAGPAGEPGPGGKAGKKGKQEGENLAATRCVLAMCENLDWNVGRILDRLEELKIGQDTIVVFFTDNGPNTARWNGGMKGRKGSLDEGGVRVPCFIRWKGRAGLPAGRKVPQVSGAIDLLPTLAEMANLKNFPPKPQDGRSLLPLLLGLPDPWPERAIFSHWAGRFSVRTQQYRLGPAGQLYDMGADPGQARDIAADKPGVKARLTALLEEHRKTLPTDGRTERPFPIGYADLPETWLPARDARSTGKIRRSSIHPNCSYFTDWRSVDDRITWDVDVLTPGRYKAVAWYTCPADQVGSTVEISLGQASARAKVEKPFDPPLLDKDDRVQGRTEGWLKDFQPMDLGTLECRAGRGTLTLRAVNVPGKQVMDLRAVTMTLLK